MEKTKFTIISDMLKLSRCISDSLQLAEGLVCGKVEDAAGRKEAYREIRRNMKAVPLFLTGIRDYIAEHDDKELARQFTASQKDTKRLHELCSALHPELATEAYRSGIAYTTMEIISQYFFPGKEAESKSGKVRKTLTRNDATDIIDIIRTSIRKCAGIMQGNKGKEEATEDMYAILRGIDKDKIQAVKEYITNTNDKDLAQLFTEDFTKTVHLSMLPQSPDIKVQMNSIKMFHIAMSMAYIKRNVLRENGERPPSCCMEEAAPGFAGADNIRAGTFTTTVQIPALRLYRFLTTFTVQSGPDKGKPVLDGNAVSDDDFIRAVIRADYSVIYRHCVKGKLRCVATLVSRAYFKDWKEYRKSAAASMGLTVESLAKYNVEKAFISQLKELLPMIK